MTTVDVFVRSVETRMEIHEEDANLCNHDQGLHNGSHWFATLGVSHARRARLLVHTRCQADGRRFIRHAATGHAICFVWRRLSPSLRCIDLPNTRLWSETHHELRLVQHVSNQSNLPVLSNGRFEPASLPIDGTSPFRETDHSGARISPRFSITSGPRKLLSLLFHAGLLRQGEYEDESEKSDYLDQRRGGPTWDVTRAAERTSEAMAMATCTALQANVASRRHARRFGRMRKVERSTKRTWKARASGEDEQNDSIAPVKLESPTGEFLTYMLQEQPELFDNAVEQQLEKLVKDKEDQQEKEDDGKGTSTDLVLYRRMGEVKAAERKAAVLDIMYACIVQNFVRIGVTLLPKLDGFVDAAPVDLNALTQGVHTPEALEMVKDHLRSVLGGQEAFSNVMVKMSKLQAAQVYIASTMFGYFLRRVDKRFQLEKTMGTLPESREEAVARLERLFNQTLDVEEGGESEPSGTGETQTTLRQYVESFDQQTLAETAQMVTQEAATITERQVGSVFGNLMELQMEMMKVVGEDAQSAEELMGRVQKAVEAGSVQSLSMTYGSLRRVVLEAVAFGSFLRDTESYVDSEYGLTPSGRFLGPGGPSSPPPPPAPTG